MAKVFQPCKEDEKNRYYPCEKTRCGHIWTVRYREPGGRSGRQREKSFDLSRDAKAFASKVENDKNAGVYLDPSRGTVTVKEYGREWLDRQRVNSETLKLYQRVFENYLYPALGRKTLAGVSNGDIEALVTSMGRQGFSKEKRKAGEGLAASTVALNFVPVKSMFKAAVRDKRIPESPCSGVTPPKTKGRRVDADEVPSIEEVHIIREAFPEHLRLMVNLMAGAGLRIGEVLAFTEDCRRSGMVRVRQQVVVSRKSAGKWFRPLKHRLEDEYRDIPLAPGLELEIDQQIEAHGVAIVEGQRVVFYSKTRVPLTHSGFRHHWRKMQEKTGLTYTPHDLRHFFASTALAGGRPIHEVSRWMGHESIQITVDIYGHLTHEAPDKMRQVMQAALWSEPRPGEALVAA